MNVMFLGERRERRFGGDRRLRLRLWLLRRDEYRDWRKCSMF